MIVKELDYVLTQSGRKGTIVLFIARMERMKSNITLMASGSLRR